MQIIMGAEAGVFVATISSIGFVWVGGAAEVGAGPGAGAGAGAVQLAKIVVDTRIIASKNNNVLFIFPP